MKLSKLLEALPDSTVYGSSDADVSAIVQDSRDVKNGYLFVALKGLNVDGHDFVDQAVANGATVIVGEKEIKQLKISKNITYVKVGNSRKAIGLLASAYYGFPAQKLKVIGITGTDGKTTTASLIYHILISSGKKTGLVSTVSAKIGKNEVDTGAHVTNPDPVSLQSFMAQMVNENCEFAVLEVTSHGLDQDRVAGITFDSAVLTNITHEHLDYHKNIDEYKRTKAKLFQTVKNFAVLNKDDGSFEFISSFVPQEVKLITYGIDEKSSDIKAENIREDNNKIYYKVIRGADSFDIQSVLPGKYNVLNSIAAIAVGFEYGVTVGSIKEALNTFNAPKGRLEKIDTFQNFDVYIDFAHTPNALENVLGLLRKKLDSGFGGKLIAVFGCAGERDSSKRPMMGEISARLADVSIFTAEDPRSEKVDAIINEMFKGAKKSGAIEIRYKTPPSPYFAYTKNQHVYIGVPERGEAIALAIQKLANKNDIVVVCGKGHEKSMAYNAKEYEWSDHDAIKAALKGDIKRIERKNS